MAGKELQAVIKLAGKLDPSVAASFDAVKAKMTTLQKSMLKSKAAMKSINTALEIKPTSAMLLTQRQRELGTQIDLTRQKLAQEKAALAELQNSADSSKTVAEQEELQRAIIMTEHELKNLEKEARAAASVLGSQFQAAGAKITEVGEKIAAVGKSYTRKVTAPIAIAGVASAKLYSDYEANFTKISTIVEANGDKTAGTAEKMSSEILKASSSVGVGATEFAQNVYDAISAGQKANEAVKSTVAATKLAKAGYAEQGEALDVLTSIQNAYGKKTVGTFENISDVLLQTQNLGKITVGEMSQSMGKVIPTAAAYDVSLQNLGATYATLTANGIKSRYATTYMNSMFDELGKSSTGVAKILKQETGKSFQELMASGQSVGDVLQTLQKHCDKTGEKFSDLWSNSNAKKAANSILGVGDKYNETLKKMENAAGTTEKAFAKFEETTAAKFERMKANLQNIAIILGGSVVQVFSPVIEKVSNFLTKLMVKFEEMNPKTRNLIVKIASVVAAIGPALLIGGKVISVFGKTVTAIGKVITVATNLGKVFKTVAGAFKLFAAAGALSPHLLIIIGIIAAVAAAAYVLIKNWDKVKEAAQKVGEAIKTAWGGVKDFFTGLWDKISEPAKKAWDTIKNVVTVGVMVIGEIISAAFQIITIPFRFIWENCKGIITSAWNAIKSFLSGVWDSISSKCQSVFNAVKAFLTPIWDGVSGVFSAAWGAISGTLASIWSGISGTAQTVWGGISNFISGVWSNVSGTATTAWGTVSSVASNAWNAVTSATSTAASTILGTVGSAMSGVWSSIQTALSPVVGLFQNVWNQATSVVSNAVARLKSIMNFSWHLPHLSLPHISVSGKFSLNPPSVPHFSIAWYRKAMANGMILNNPTIFGMMNGKLLGAGEAGPEVVAGAGSLSAMIQSSVASGINSVRGAWNSINQPLGYPAMVGQMLNAGVVPSGAPVYVSGGSNTRNVHIGGITFAPKIDVKTPGGTSAQIDESFLIRLLRKYEPQLVDIILEAIEERGDGDFVDNDWVY